MVDILYNYTTPENPYKIESTDSIAEFVELLYSGHANFISDGQRIELGLPENYFDFLKIEISKYEERVPLYDISYNHIYLIYAENVYPNIHENNYRFVDQNFYDELIKYSTPSESDLTNIRILSHYNFDVLNQTYLNIFYKSYVLNNYITSCRRPSYASKMDHISPYYSTKELYYLAYDWNLTEKSVLTDTEQKYLCKIISEYDIPAETLLSHQMYIYDLKAIGLVKYYSLSGSYYMNQYLRKTQCCINNQNRDYSNVIRNLDLENQIKIMTNLVRSAPPFLKSHTVYRFVERDDYLQHLKPGDVYTDSSFMSTTRNPFYYQENYAFGYILMKIKLPDNLSGIGLSIEAYSNFPTEEEIILPPTTRLRLESVTDATENAEYHHILNKKITRKYEFTWVGNSFIDDPAKEFIIDMPGAYIPEINVINLSDLLNDDYIKLLSISERLQYFRTTYVNNMNNQFIAIIGDNKYIFNLRSYDSSSVYKKFFYYEVADGIMITSANPKYGNINILLEIGNDLHVNYYFRYSVTDSSHLVDLNRKEWIEWLSLLAYVIGCRNVIFHSNYELHYNKSDSVELKQMKTRYTYSQNIYQYLKNKKKFFDEFNQIVPEFDYWQLDLLYLTAVTEIVAPSDKNELYTISITSGANNLRELYLYIIEKFPKLLTIFYEKMELFYRPEVNPFNHISYKLDPWQYLYDKQLIKYIPAEKDFIVKKGAFKKLVGDKKIPKFKNRLRIYLVNE